MIKNKQCSSKSLSRNYLASKCAKCYVCKNRKITELSKPVQINQFPFIWENCCSYRKSKSHDQYDETKNPLNFSETFCKKHVQKISDTFWPICKHFTLMLFIGDCLWCERNERNGWYFTNLASNDKSTTWKKFLCFTIPQQNGSLKNEKKKKTKKPRLKFWWDDKMIYEIFFAG